MKEITQIDIKVLEKEAKNSEHHESYRVLEKSCNYRIGLGARLTSSGHISFFIEVLVYLCPDNAVDLSLLEKKLTLLRELEKRKYFLNCQEDNYISCEVEVPSENLIREYDIIDSMINRTFQHPT